MRRRAIVVAAVLAVLWSWAGPAQAGEAGAQGRLLAALWPARVATLPGAGPADPAGWAEADRRVVWTRLLLEAVSRPAADRTTGHPAARALPPLPQAVLDAPPGDRPGDAATGAPSEEASSRCPALVRGMLPWPARGSRGPVGRNAGPGLVVATEEGEPVRAVAEGRVVFVGRLRGLGPVIIVAHGPHCHTVTACLSEVAVAEGDEVSRDALLGRAGFCPPARGAGVYFELRFREKALNAAEWFAAGP